MCTQQGWGRLRPAGEDGPQRASRLGLEGRGDESLSLTTSMAITELTFLSEAMISAALSRREGDVEETTISQHIHREKEIRVCGSGTLV